MTDFCKVILSVLIAFLVPQISAADEPLVEDKERALVNSKTSDATSNPEKEICKRIKVTGSHLKTRVCMSAKDWEHLRRKTQQQLDDIMSSSASLGGGMNG